MPENDELRAAMLAGELSVAACLAAARGEHKEWQFKDELLRETIECIRDLYESNEQHDASFNLRWKADQRAIKRWLEAHPGKENVWPDHADLCIWLMEQLARPPLTRERVAEAVATLFIHPDGSRSHECGWTEGTIVDRLCRLLGVEE